ncbi:MAG TPA: ABC transporter ATP-binding protein [Armatimonadota bacterium]|jgi:ABC-2 type transport system ATP-binding protein
MSETEWVVEASQLTRRFGRFTAVDRVDLRVPRGSIFGFLGPSGSGKSTTMRMLCGLLKPTSGRGTVDGLDIEKQPDQVRQCLGYMAQKFSLYPDLLVRENLQFYGGIYGLAPDRLGARIDEVLRNLGLSDLSDTLTGELPLGWKQRVALAAAVLHQPPVLFLDEPTSGVDPTSRRLFWSTLDDLASGGASLIISTHTMDDAERCDLVGIMFEGRLIATDHPKRLKEQYSGHLYHVQADPLLKALEVAKGLPGIEDAAMFGTALHLTAATEDRESLRSSLVQAGLQVGDIHPIEPSMEDVFVQAIARSQREERSTDKGAKRQ